MVSLVLPSPAYPDVNLTIPELPMADIATTAGTLPQGGSLLDKKSHKFPAWISGAIVLVALVGGLGYVGFHIAGDLGNVTTTSTWAYILLGVALLIALGFEFVNGFHDTANAVATVIYTHSLEPNIAVVWSGLCNLVGVLTSAGTVAFTIITLLPVELILKVSSGAGFCHGLRALDCCDSVESGHLVAGPSRLQHAHHDRLHHRRRRSQPADVELRLAALRASTGNRPPRSSKYC